MNRRGFITGMAALIAAPSIVRASSLMPVKVLMPANDVLIPGDVEWGEHLIKQIPNGWELWQKVNGVWGPIVRNTVWEGISYNPNSLSVRTTNSQPFFWQNDFAYSHFE